MALLLNCDLGESYGAWKMGADRDVMPHIDQANIACGFHAGDPVIMHQTLELAKQHGVAAGAHPSYPDLAGFGRRPISCSDQEIRALLHYQMAALEGMAKLHGLPLSYVKPHGALYNDMMANPHIRAVIMNSVAQWPTPTPLMLQATTDFRQHQQEADTAGISLMFEAFADRRYQDSGLLVPRSQPGAVLGKDEMLEQVRQLRLQGTILSASGKPLELQVDTLCVHGDNAEGVRAIEAIRQLVRP